MGTALKILFSYGENADDFRLTRGEIVALFNAMNRLSNSIWSLHFFMDENQPPAAPKEPVSDKLNKINSKESKTKKEKKEEMKQQKAKRTKGEEIKKKRDESIPTKPATTSETREATKVNQSGEPANTESRRTGKSKAQEWTWEERKQIIVSLIWVVLVYVALK
jgi:hypothetical protein